MRVLVCVDVGNRDSGGLNFLDLCPGLSGNFSGGHSTDEGLGSESRQTSAESARLGEGRNLLGVEGRHAVDQHNVTSGAQSGKAGGE